MEQIGTGDLERVRSLFRRVTGQATALKGDVEQNDTSVTAGQGARTKPKKLAAHKGPRLNRKKAAHWFDKWSAFESEYGDQKAVNKVKKLHEAWIKKYNVEHGV